MKTIVIILIALFNISISSAQKPLVMQYNWQANGLNVNCIFYFDSYASVFIVEDKELKRNEKSKSKNTSSDVINIRIDDGKDFVLHKNYETRLMRSRELIFDWSKCILLDTMPNFDWKMLPDRKKIGQFNCQKATMSWRCSDYQVWFTTEIPYSIGPWKLHGLPGLIVEATNLTANHHYLLTSLSENTTPQMRSAIKVPEGKDPVYSFEKYCQIQKKELKKMEAFLKMKAGNPEDGEFKMNGPECF